MTAEEFRLLFDERNDEQLLSLCLRDDTPPYVFEPRPQSWETFRNLLATELRVSRSDIRIVGSGRFGFSLKPGSGLRGFADKSDIDVVVVDPALFDELWVALLEAAYPRPPITEWIGGWLKERRSELYTGWISPLEIKLDKKIIGSKAQRVLDFNTRWFNTLKSASQHPPRRHEDIKGRLYRSWRHAELYHLNSLAALRKDLSGWEENDES